IRPRSRFRDPPARGWRTPRRCPPPPSPVNAPFFRIRLTKTEKNVRDVSEPSGAGGIKGGRGRPAAGPRGGLCCRPGWKEKGTFIIFKYDECPLFRSLKNTTLPADGQAS